jgi:hypothetical protein
MQSITSVTTLREAIVALESRRREQERQLVNHCMLIYESLKPLNIIKTVIRDLVGSADARHHVLNASMSVASGYLSRKLFFRSPSGPMKKILGALLQFGITNLMGISLYRKHEQ